MSINELIEVNKLVYGVDKPKISRIKVLDMVHVDNFVLAYLSRNQILYFDAPVYMTIQDNKGTQISPSFVVTNFIYISDVLDLTAPNLNVAYDFGFSVKSVVPDYFDDKGNFVCQFGNNALINCYFLEYDNDIWLW